MQYVVNLTKTPTVSLRKRIANLSEAQVPRKPGGVDLTHYGRRQPRPAPRRTGTRAAVIAAAISEG